MCFFNDKFWGRKTNYPQSIHHFESALLKRNLGAIFLIIFLIVLPSRLYAEASGPDYFELKSSKAIQLYANTEDEQKTLGLIYPKTRFLRNMACKDMPTFPEWQKNRNPQNRKPKNNGWCQVEFAGQVGWVPAQHLTEQSDYSASFDCRQAKGAVEEAICADTHLKALDYMLNMIYMQALNKAESFNQEANQQAQMLKAFQRGWIKGRNECWKSEGEMKECIIDSYQRRILTLQVEWQLIEPASASSYQCQPSNESIHIASYRSQYMPVIAAGFLGELKVMMAEEMKQATTFEGGFGSTITIDPYGLIMRWSQDESQQKCSPIQKEPI